MMRVLEMESPEVERRERCSMLALEVRPEWMRFAQASKARQALELLSATMSR